MDYFKHDYGARHDPRIVRLVVSLGYEGVGIYWSIVEYMYEQSGALKIADIPIIAHSIGVPVEKLEKVLKSAFLFKKDEYYSDRILIELSDSEHRKEDDAAKKSYAGTKSGEARRKKARILTRVEHLLNKNEGVEQSVEHTLNLVSKLSKVVKKEEKDSIDREESAERRERPSIINAPETSTPASSPLPSTSTKTSLLTKGELDETLKAKRIAENMKSKDVGLQKAEFEAHEKTN